MGKLNQCGARLISKRLLPKNPNKTLIIFVGGALDHHYKPLFAGVYLPYHLRHSHRQSIVYAGHRECKVILKQVTHWQDHGQSICLVGHSWGCQTILDVAHKIADRNSIEVLVTLDPVSRRFINQRSKKPSSVKQWFNVYIDVKQSPFESSNRIALLGGRWNYRKNADKNIQLQRLFGEEVTHAKARLMFATVEDELIAV